MTMHVRKSAALAATFAAALATTLMHDSHAEAAPKNPTTWHAGKLTALEVTAEGTLKAAVLSTDAKASRSVTPCPGTRIADHPELVAAMQHGWLTRAQVVNGCAVSWTLNR